MNVHWGLDISILISRPPTLYVYRDSLDIGITGVESLYQYMALIYVQRRGLGIRIVRIKFVR